MKPHRDGDCFDIFAYCIKNSYYIPTAIEVYITRGLNLDYIILILFLEVLHA